MRKTAIAGLLALAACSGTPDAPPPQEFLVIGNSMSFERCRARGGLIIRDTFTSMIACDPTVRRTPVPAEQIGHPIPK